MLAIYKRGRGIKTWDFRVTIQPVVWVGIEPGITVLQIQPVVWVGIESGITVLQIQPVVWVGIEPRITVLEIQPVVWVGIEPGISDSGILTTRCIFSVGYSICGKHHVMLK